MSNSLYMGYKQVLTGDAAMSAFSVPNLETGTQRLILCDGAEYSANTASDKVLSDVPAASRVREVAIAGGSITQIGTTSKILYSCTSPVTFPTVVGDQSEMLVLYNQAGTEAGSLLIVLIDQFISGIPVTPNGGDVEVFFDSGIWAW